MEMQEQHVGFLKAILNVTELPDQIVRMYWNVKKLADRRDVPLDEKMLVMMAAQVVQSSDDPIIGSAPGETRQAVLIGSQSPEGVPCEAFFEGETHQAIMLEDQSSAAPGTCRVLIAGSNVAENVPEDNVKLRD